MKTLPTLGLIMGCMWVQSAPAAGAEDQPKPLILTVTGAQGSVAQDGTAAEIMGYLSDDPRRRPVPLYCKQAVAIREPDGNPIEVCRNLRPRNAAQRHTYPCADAGRNDRAGGLRVSASAVK